MYLLANNLDSNRAEEREHPEVKPGSSSWIQGDVKVRMKGGGGEGGRMKPCSWAERSVENSRQKHRKTGEGWGRSSGTVTGPVRGRPPQS